jgi:hypothetical protein
LLADVILHKGNEAKYIKEISIVLFALIYVHYSIDESEWQKSHGNILNIVESINKKGIKIIEKTREPKNIIERILKIIFRGDFKEKIEAYDILGIRGLEELVPIVYKLINIYENGSLSVLPDEKINDIISSYTSDMSLQIDAKNTMDLANTIGDLLKDLLDQSNQSKSREKK